MENISFEEVFNFIDKAPIPQVKAEYKFKNKNQKRKLAMGVVDFILRYGQYDLVNPIIGKFKHKIYFAPHPDALQRLLEKEAFIEYALHFITQKQNENVDIRTFDSSKFKTIAIINTIIKRADGFYNTKDGINYYKKRKTKKYNNAILILKLNIIEDKGMFRVAGFMPNRTDSFIASKKATASGISTPEAMITGNP